MKSQEVNKGSRSIDVLDIIMLAIGVGFFALSIVYTLACDRL